MKTINKTSAIFNAVNEIFRDNHIKPSEAYMVDFTESEAVFSNEFGKVTVPASQKFIFDNLKAEFFVMNLRKDFWGTKFHRVVSQALALEDAINVETQDIKSQVSIVRKVGNEAHQFGLSSIVFSNPELVSTLALFSVCNVNQAFTEKQACSLVCEVFVSAQGEKLLNDAVVEQLRNHIRNIKEIYKTGFIFAERIS